VGGMQWSLTTSDALASVRTLFLNEGWDRSGNTARCCRSLSNFPSL
jgi:hypothetical protein